MKVLEAVKELQIQVCGRKIEIKARSICPMAKFTKYHAYTSTYGSQPVTAASQERYDKVTYQISKNSHTCSSTKSIFVCLNVLVMETNGCMHI